jgi:predicted transcriptional regulator
MPDRPIRKILSDCSSDFDSALKVLQKEGEADMDTIHEKGDYNPQEYHELLVMKDLENLQEANLVEQQDDSYRLTEQGQDYVEGILDED